MLLLWFLFSFAELFLKTPQANQNKAHEVRVREIRDIYLIRLLATLVSKDIENKKKKKYSKTPAKKLHKSSKVQGLAEMWEKSINLNN